MWLNKFGNNIFKVMGINIATSIFSINSLLSIYNHSFYIIKCNSLQYYTATAISKFIS